MHRNRFTNTGNAENMVSAHVFRIIAWSTQVTVCTFVFAWKRQIH